MAEALQPGPLPVGSLGRRSLGWWGMLTAICTEASLFGYLLFSYLYFAVQLPRSWMPEPYPSLKFVLPITVVQLVSAATAWWAQGAIVKGRRGQAEAGLAATFLLGIAVLVLQYLDAMSKTFTIRSGAYGSLYFTISGFDAVHVAFGVGALLMVLIWTALGYFDGRRNGAIHITAIYWYFVTAVWIAVFICLYLTPYLGLG